MPEMLPKHWTTQVRSKFRRSPPPKGTGQRLKLLFWLALGISLPWLFRTVHPGRSTEPQISFDEALQTVAELGQNRNSNSVLGEDSAYGITQTVYNAWRRRQNQSLQSISRISSEEVRAIYQGYWQQGNCDRYAAPLDMVCLDSLVSFGPATGKQFLVNLPEDPKSASLEVAQRRQAYRQELARNQPRVPAQQQVLEAELEHDRALVALIESYSTSEQLEFSSGLRRWLDSGQDEQTEHEHSEESQPGWNDRSSRDQPSRDQPSRDQSDTRQLAAEQIYTEAKPFVVEVWISTTGIVAPAAGVLLSSDGLVLTNYHVINASTFDFVRSADGKDFSGRILEVDPSLDLALIQLDEARNLPTANLAAQSSHIQVGDTVYAIGSPLGFHWKMTTAEVIEVQSDCGLPSLRCIRTPADFLRPGNSGGPLLDQSGQVVGINRAIQDGTGEGVSIPIETVKQFVERAKGKV